MPKNQKPNLNYFLFFNYLILFCNLCWIVRKWALNIPNNLAKFISLLITILYVLLSFVYYFNVDSIKIYRKFWFEREARKEKRFRIFIIVCHHGVEFYQTTMVHTNHHWVGRFLQCNLRQSASTVFPTRSKCFLCKFNNP